MFVLAAKLLCNSSLGTLFVRTGKVTVDIGRLFQISVSKTVMSACFEDLFDLVLTEKGFNRCVGVKLTLHNHN